MTVAKRANDNLIVIGWREWARLPELGIKRIKTKIDTGARSSSLHAYDICVSDAGATQFVDFKVQPLQSSQSPIVQVRAVVSEFRQVRSSNGQLTNRPVIRTKVEIFGELHDIDVTLFDRTKMSFRMLIGREALRGRFLVDSSKSFCGGKPKKKMKLKKDN